MFKWHLKNILKSRNISQAEFSRRIKMREATVSLYCRGKLKEARIKDLHAMCKELNCQIDDIIEYIPKKYNKRE